MDASFATARLELHLSRDPSMRFLEALSEIPSLQVTIERGRMTPSEVRMVVRLQGAVAALERAMGLGRGAGVQRPASAGSMAASSSESSSA